MLEQPVKELNRKCNECGKYLGYFNYNTKKPYKAYYFSNNPKKINDKKYYRIKCIDCFYKKYNRLPNKPNVVNYDFQYLLGIDFDTIRKKTKSRAVTLENMINRHGEEIGKQKWKSYCDKQAYVNTFEYKNEKYGWTEDKFKEYNKSRAVTIDNLINRHGWEKGNKIFKEYCERQKYAGISLEYFIKKYGKIEGTKKWKEVNKKKSLTLDNFIRKYGDDEGILKFEEYINNKSCSFSSKISDEFCNKIISLIDGKVDVSKNIYCNIINREFGKRYQKTYYKWDFVCTKIKLAIEFNGNYWHCNPNMYDAKWEHPVIGLLAEEIWKQDEIKNNFLKSFGYDIIIVWEKNYVEDPNKICYDIAMEIIRRYNEIS